MMIAWRSDLLGGQTSMHYHVYNRGAHKLPIFLDVSDYERFWALLYASNDTNPMPLGWYKSGSWPNFARTPLVEIFAYCLMPNHFHIGINEISEGNLEKFMRKLGTAYTMYYNLKYKHSGTIFQGSYKAREIRDNNYYMYLVQYIHLNPFGLEEPDLDSFAKNARLEEAKDYSRKYMYSSFKDYLGEVRQQANILKV